MAETNAHAWKKVTRSQASLDGTNRWLIEASAAGFAPGEWPPYVEFDGLTMTRGSAFYVRGGLGGYNYRGSNWTLVVFND